MSSRVHRLKETRDVDALLVIASDTSARHRSDALMAVMELIDEEGDSSPFADPAARVARTLVSDPDRRVRAMAISALSVARDPSAASVAIAGLRDPEPSVRTASLIAIANRKPPGTVDDVLRTLGDPDSTVRACAAAALAELGETSVRRYLKERMEREGDEFVRRALSDSIEKLETEGPESSGGDRPSAQGR